MVDNLTVHYCKNFLYLYLLCLLLKDFFCSFFLPLAFKLNYYNFNNVCRQWTSGEPFDHAHGKERCAILQINQHKLDDVDCDLNGNNMHFYRFVCERTYENHLKVVSR